MHTNGVIAEISDTAFFESLGNNRSLNDIIKNIEYGKKKKVTEYENQLIKQLEKIDANKLEIVDRITKGQFGPVLLVKDRDNQEYVAKIMSKYERWLAIIMWEPSGKFDFLTFLTP